jgi:hypothetical protein
MTGRRLEIGPRLPLATPFLMLVHEPAGHAHQLGIGVRGSVCQQVERLQTCEVLAVHQDAFGLADEVATGHTSIEQT